MPARKPIRFIKTTSSWHVLALGTYTLGIVLGYGFSTGLASRRSISAYFLDSENVVIAWSLVMATTGSWSLFCCVMQWVDETASRKVWMWFESAASLSLAMLLGIYWLALDQSGMNVWTTQALIAVPALACAGRAVQLVIEVFHISRQQVEITEPEVETPEV